MPDWVDYRTVVDGQWTLSPDAPAALVLQGLAAIIRRLPEAAARALREEAEIEMTEAKQRTPVDTGELERSGYVTPVTIEADRIAVTLGFGGPAAPYAIHVHEDLDAHHPNGQAKFLESTLTESAPHLADRIARHLDVSGLVR